jgi:hypothetical protein
MTASNFARLDGDRPKITQLMTAILQAREALVLWLVVRERRHENREYRTPRVGRSHFGGGGSGSRSAVPTYPQRPHKWTTSPDSGRTVGSLRASRIASPHWGQSGAVSGSFRTSMHAATAGSISAHAARQTNTAASRAEKLVLGSATPNRLPQPLRGPLVRFPSRLVQSEALKPGSWIPTPPRGINGQISHNKSPTT